MVIPVFFLDDRNPPSLHAIEPLATTTPPSRCGLIYLNEGGANFVFRIVHPVSASVPAQLNGRLLRIRKDLPHVQPAEAQLEAFYANFHGLFPESSLVQHELVVLEQSVLALLNTEIQAIDRPSHRAQDFLPEEDLHALLVSDMTVSTENTEDEVLLQLKPKWLAQSPNAPEDAKRCRTCALRASRAARNVQTATDAQGSCPLGLISGDVEVRRRAARELTDDEMIRKYLVEDVQPVLQHLRTSQTELDPGGVLTISEEGAERTDLCKAMTLRDCTLFVKRVGKEMEAKLGDLDMKQPQKIERWREVEKELIENGWYTNTEREDIWIQESVCLLSQT